MCGLDLAVSSNQNYKRRVTARSWLGLHLDALHFTLNNCILPDLTVGNIYKQNLFLSIFSDLCGLHLDALHFTVNNCILPDLTVGNIYRQNLFLSIFFDLCGLHLDALHLFTLNIYIPDSTVYFQLAIFYILQESSGVGV